MLSLIAFFFSHNFQISIIPVSGQWIACFTKIIPKYILQIGHTFSNQLFSVWIHQTGLREHMHVTSCVDLHLLISFSNSVLPFCCLLCLFSLNPFQ